MSANRLNAPNQFETLASPWILSQLDTNFTQNQAAWNDSSIGFMNGVPTDTGSANIYSITLPLGVPSAYQAGMCVSFIPTHTNTSASTLTVSPLGSAAIVNPANLALSGGEIAANRKLDLIHDGTSFRIIGLCPLNITLTGQSGNVPIECAGATSVTLSITWATAPTTVTLNHLAQGVQVNMVCINSSGAGSALLVTATDPGGTTFTKVNSVAAYSGGSSAFSNLQAGGITLNNTAGLKLSGAAPAPLVLYLSV